MNYCKYEIGDLVKLKVNGQPYIIYKIVHTEEEGRLYGVQSSKAKFDPNKLEYVPRETFKMWTHSNKDTP